jgi:DNA-directed RNA polymerase subunit alpha
MWKGFQRPQRVEIDSQTASPSYGRFIAQPLERGFGTTIGNAMRRCLLSSIEGAAITAIQIEGVLHEFSAIPGVVEDVTDIILNLKQVPIRIPGEEPRFISIDIKGPAVVRAGDFGGDPNVEIADPEALIATVNEEGHFKLQARVGWGRGYVSAEKNFDETMGIGWVPIDSVHGPVRRVNYKVEAARLGRATDYERLVVEVWTNGTVPPEDSVSLAAQLLQDHLSIFMVTERSVPALEAGADRGVMSEQEALLARSVDELELSVRSVNTLKNANIHTIGDLVSRSERDMLEAKGFGRKSLEELHEALEKLGLQLGMNTAEREPVGSP